MIFLFYAYHVSLGINTQDTKSRGPFKSTYILQPVDKIPICKTEFSSSLVTISYAIRRHKAKARKSREMDMMSDFDNLDIMLGNENITKLRGNYLIQLRDQQFSKTLSQISVQWKTFPM